MARDRERPRTSERQRESQRVEEGEGKRKRGGTRNAGIDSRRRQPAASLKHTTESTRLRDSIYRRDKEGSSREPMEERRGTGERERERTRETEERTRDHVRGVDRFGLAISHR